MGLMGSPREHFLRSLRFLRNLSLEIVRYRRVAGAGQGQPPAKQVIPVSATRVFGRWDRELHSSRVVPIAYSGRSRHLPRRCNGWCTKVYDGSLYSPASYVYPANLHFSKARPAGFEPATGGLEVGGDGFQHVPTCCRTRLVKPNPSKRCCSLLRVVATG